MTLAALVVLEFITSTGLETVKLEASSQAFVERLTNGETIKAIRSQVESEDLEFLRAYKITALETDLAAS